MIAIFSEQNLKIECAQNFNQPVNSDIFCDIALISQGFVVEKFKIFAKIIIFCGDDVCVDIGNLMCENLITYGLSCKNTVTISSHSDDEIMLAVQRVFNTAFNTQIDIGEMPVMTHYNRSIDDLAIAVLGMVLCKKLP